MTNIGKDRVMLVFSYVADSAYQLELFKNTIWELELNITKKVYNI